MKKQMQKTAKKRDVAAAEKTAALAADSAAKIWREFIALYNAPQELPLYGVQLPGLSEELGFLAGRVLDDLNIPVPRPYCGHDRYQKNSYRTSGGSVNFGTLTSLLTVADWALKHELLLRQMRELARNPLALAILGERQKGDVEMRMFLRRVFEQIATSVQRA